MNLKYVALSLILFAVLVIVLGIVKIHTYPGRVARARQHPQVEAIEVTSLLGLLVFPLWMFALVWSYSGAVIGKLYELQPVTAGNVADGAHDAAGSSPLVAGQQGDSGGPARDAAPPPNGTTPGPDAGEGGIDAAGKEA